MVAAQARLTPHLSASMAAAQTDNVIATISGLAVDPSRATTLNTELLEALGADSPVFNQEQRTTIAGSVGNRAIGIFQLAVQSDGGGSREQAHLFMHNYYPRKVWALIRSADTMPNKCKQLAEFGVKVLGLRNPNAQTKVRMVATIFEAMQLDQDPSAAYDAVQDFAKAFKVTRELYKNTYPQTMSVFPEDVNEFVRLYPQTYPETDPPIECDVSIDQILARSHKSNTPARNTNKRVTGKKQQPCHAPAASSQLALPQQQSCQQIDANALVQTVFRYMMSGSDAPNLGALRRFGLGGDERRRDADEQLNGFEDLRGQAPGGRLNRGATDGSIRTEGNGEDSSIAPFRAGFARGDTNGVGALPGCFAGSVGVPQGNLAQLKSEVEAALNRTRGKYGRPNDEVDATADADGGAAASAGDANGDAPATAHDTPKRGKYHPAKAMKAMKSKDPPAKVMKAMKSKAKAKAIRIPNILYEYNA